MVSQEQFLRLHARFGDEGTSWIRRRTVPIYKMANGGNPVPHGTGVLLQVADHKFVVTAAHVLNVWTEMRLVIPIGENNAMDLRSAYAHVTTNEDHVDFAVIKLTAEMANALPNEYQFVRLAEIDVHGTEPTQGIHAVFGYPQQLAERDEVGLTSKAIFYPSNLITQADTDGAISLAMEIHPETSDENGDRAPLPALNCISGCGIWRLHQKGDDIDTWNADRIRLVGIEHTVLVNKWIRGVRIRQVAGGIATLFPELEPCIALLGIKIHHPQS